MVRFIIWATIGRVMDLLTVLLTALFLPLWWFYFRRKGWYTGPYETKVNITAEELIALGGKDPTRYAGFFSDNKDHHGLMCQVGYGFFNERAVKHSQSLLALSWDNVLFRSIPGNFDDPNPNAPSIDMLAAWLYYYVQCDVKVSHLVSGLSLEFLRNIFCLKDYDGTISQRCSLGGMTYLKGSRETWHGLTKPNFGQEALVGSAMLALASRELGGFWNVTYWVHYFMHFVWFWRLFPWLPFVFKGKDFCYPYVGYVSQMALYVLDSCGHSNRWGLRWNACVCKPGQGIQPYLGGLASKYLSKEEKKEALAWLLNSADATPENFNLQPFNKGPFCSMPALCAWQLTR